MSARKDRNSRVTVAYLLERQVALDWREAVAIVLEIADLLKRSGGCLPGDDGIALTPHGAIEFVDGYARSGDVGPALARMLGDLRRGNLPIQLRLLVSTAIQTATTAESYRAFISALEEFDHAGRPRLLSSVYHRAADRPTTPAQSSYQPQDKWAHRASPVQPPVVSSPAAMMALAAAVVAVGAMSLEYQQPGTFMAGANSLESMTSSAFRAVAESTEPLRQRSQEPEAVESTITPALPNAQDATVGRQRVELPRPSAVQPRANVTTDPIGAVPRRRVADVETDWAARRPQSFRRAAPARTDAMTPPPPGVTSPLFDETDTSVMPPSALADATSLTGPAPWSHPGGVVEAIVSPTGNVEKVRLIPPAHSIHHSMSLSAIKTWRFHPATKDGSAVRYRLQVALTH